MGVGPRIGLVIALVFTAIVLQLGPGWASALAQDEAASPPLHPRARRLIRMGQAMQEAGNRVMAIGYFREAINVDPRAEPAYLALGRIYELRRAHRDALAVYRAGLRHLPDSSGIWFALAQLHLALNRPRDAREALREVLHREPDHQRGLELVAQIAQQHGAWTEALNTQRALIRAARARGAPSTELAELRRYERALERLAGSLDPVTAPRACRGSALRRQLARCADVSPPR